MARPNPICWPDFGAERLRGKLFLFSCPAIHYVIMAMQKRFTSDSRFLLTESAW